MRQPAHVEPAEVVDAAKRVGTHLARGFHMVEIWCRPCHRMQEVTVADLPLSLPIAVVCKRFRCTECGGQELSSNVSLAEIVAFEQAGQR